MSSSWPSRACWGQVELPRVRRSQPPAGPDALPRGVRRRLHPGLALPVRIPGVPIEYLRLRMPDGVHLAATHYLPEDVSAVKRVSEGLATQHPG